MIFLRTSWSFYFCVTFLAFKFVSGDVHQGEKKVDETYCDKDEHKHMHLSNFTHFQHIHLDPGDSFVIHPNWVVYERGTSVVQSTNSDPSLLVNFHYFKGVDFDGTFFVDTDIDDDYFGLVFSYENNKQFYAIMWKKEKQVYWNAKPSRVTAEAGVQIKLVKSAGGPSAVLRNALWNTGDTENEVKLLWKDPNNLGWKSQTPYEWKLIHRPTIGLIKLTIYQNKEAVVQTTIFDKTLQGGRVGLLDFSQEMVIWSDMRYRCNENLRNSIHSELPAELKCEVTNGTISVGQIERTKQRKSFFFENNRL